MTTIAWDGEHLAADSQSQCDYIEQVETPKIFKRKGKIFAVAGDYPQSVAVIDWLCGGEKPDIDKPDYEVLAFSDKAEIYSEQLIPFEVKPPCAIGSGSGYAMGAMLAGASAKLAVEIASKLDPHTGGKVKVVKCQ